MIRNAAIVRRASHASSRDSQASDVAAMSFRLLCDSEVDDRVVRRIGTVALRLGNLEVDKVPSKSDR